MGGMSKISELHVSKTIRPIVMILFSFLLFVYTCCGYCHHLFLQLGSFTYLLSVAVISTQIGVYHFLIFYWFGKVSYPQLHYIVIGQSLMLGIFFCQIHAQSGSF